MTRIVSAALAALALATPLAAAGQEIPSYAVPSQAVRGDEQLRGRITNFDGEYGLTVRDERGFIDNVALHPGTIINPRGLTLAPGMVVSVLGYNAGATFAANEIDTPYTYSTGVPYYRGHAWDYYGPSVSLSFFFGNRGWWHGDAFRGGYTYYSGARYYNDVRVTNVYGGGGSFHGRDFVAPREHGGYYRGEAHAEQRGGEHARDHGHTR